MVNVSLVKRRLLVSPPPPMMARQAALLRLGLLTSLGIVYLAFAYLTHQRNVPILCPFRRVTGHRCPFCGLTTASGHALHGEWRAAQHAYPLLVPVYGFALIWFLRLIKHAAVTAPSAAPRRS